MLYRLEAHNTSKHSLKVLTQMKVLLTSAVRNTGMATIRGLAHCGLDVVGADDRQLAFNCRSRYLRRLYLHAPVENEHFFVQSLLAIIEKEHPDVFLTIEGIHLVAAQPALFEIRTRVLVPPQASYETANDNQATLKACRKLGIDCPRLFRLEDAKWYLRKHRERFLVVKPRRDIGAGRGIRYVDCPRSLCAAQKEVEAQWGDCVIEEYIPGGTANMHTVNLLFDQHHRLAAYFTTRKIRQWPNSGGITALSISTHEPALVRKVLPFFQKHDWKGLAEVELKIDARDGKAKIIEINPRVWGYFGFPICCGVNFPFLYCQVAMGQSPPANQIGNYRVGLKYINPFAYAKAVMAAWVRRDAERERWRLGDEMRGPMVGNYFDWRDGHVIFAKMIYEAKAGLWPAGQRHL